MCWGTLGTVRPFPNFHAERDVVEIQAALDSKDVVTLVRILTNRTNAQRQAIADAFEELTQKDGGIRDATSNQCTAEQDGDGRHQQLSEGPEQRGRRGSRRLGPPGLP
ncbi:Annexin A2 [Liparis tanakae]|uniref:Annexin A2 n=1 Tax=Liparis tanakae TaxID=230148 RepID=A0A4Z2GG25_9TELE|nr:Annexin A2 [Liparis tanakae]